jgi:hypothetical protein
MKILINDLMQFSDLPDDLKTPSLDDRVLNTGLLTVNFTIPNEYNTFDIFDGIGSQPLFLVGVTVFAGVGSQPLSVPTTILDGVAAQPLSVLGADQFDCIGIGGTDATNMTINGSIVISSDDGNAFTAGLYELGEFITASQITIEHNGTFMGRIAAGVCKDMAISPSREPGFFTSVKKRRSLSGQVVAPAGGYGGEVIGVDFRYKVDRSIYTEFQRAYVTQIMAGFPFFLDFDSDDWLPRNKFYGETDNNLIFQSSTNFFKYSRRFEFQEAF